MQRGLIPSIFGTVVLCLAGVGLFSIMSEQDHLPDFVILNDGILWLESTEQSIYSDMQHAAKYLEKRNLKPRRIYLDRDETLELVSTFSLDPKLKRKVLSEPGILFDCRQNTP